MGIRIIKTAMSVMLAIYLAELLQLKSPMSAGLLAILGVDVTRKKSLQNAFERISASALGMFLAAFLFFLFGFHIWVIALFILAAYPVLSRIRLKDGIVTSSVIVFRVYGEQSLSFETLANQLSILFIGFGSATLLNLLYMPSWERHMLKERMETEEAFSQIFIEIAKTLRSPAHVWSGEQLIDAEKAVKEGETLARRASDNSLFASDDQWLRYFLMRDQQLEIIKRMLVLLARVYENLPYGAMTAELFESISDDVRNEYYTGKVEEELRQLELAFKTMPLPATREEFETRAAILQIFLDLEHYLSIAKQEKKKRNAEKKVSQ